ncbi:MAG: biosynthetic-type acetolactate synthase large subunit [Dehalococcoidia bacterium]|nr:biosynthetic-type acetolactate synthase large subunit [Dehalococcoidia bacterium]
MKRTGAQIVFECLLREGVRHIFGYPGGANLPLYDTFKDYPQIQHILVRHEQSAAHAADAYARVTGDAGVCFATSGPGATNLVTGIATAWMDSVPIVCVTGAVVTSLIGRDGFQEADITGITLPVTKHNYLVTDVHDIARVMKEAFHIARTGRPGPVLVDIPRDTQQMTADFHYPETVHLRGYRVPGHPDPAEVKRAAKLIEEAERPLILAGHGVILSKAYDELLELAEKCDIPVITTLLGISGFPGTHPLFQGMPGMHGMYWNNMAISESDLLLGLGMRFDDRVTGRLKDFAPNAKIVHADVDPAEMGKNVRPTVALLGDLKATLQDLNREVGGKRHPDWKAWLARTRAEHPSITIPETDKLLPQFVLKQLYEATKGQAYVVTGVGQHQMWAAQYYWYDRPNSFVTSGGLGTMGFEVPAALGVQVARPKDVVWSVAGDGGFQMTMQELATLVEYELPVKFALLNNGYLGMVKQWQQLFYNDNRSAVKMFNPDFVKLAEAFGMVGLRVTDKTQVAPAIEQAMRHPGPVLVEFVVDEDENCYPMVPPGAALQETIDQPAMAPARRREEAVSRS